MSYGERPCSNEAYYVIRLRPRESRERRQETGDHAARQETGDHAAIVEFD